MALITCPECNKEISETASACPNCGYIIQGSSENEKIIPTKIGELKRNVPLGVVLIVVGIIGILGGIILLAVFIGIFAIIGGVLLILAGMNKVNGTRAVICPFCKKTFYVGKAGESLKCNVCKKRSIIDGDYVKPVL